MIANFYTTTSVVANKNVLRIVTKGKIKTFVQITDRHRMGETPYNKITNGEKEKKSRRNNIYP